jgi:hypothetical protein
LYVALSNRDAVAAVNVGAGQFSVKGYFDTRLPHQSYFGAEPVALAINGDGSRLYVANMASDAVAVIDTAQLTRRHRSREWSSPSDSCPPNGCPFQWPSFLPHPAESSTSPPIKGREPGPTTSPSARSSRCKAGQFAEGQRLHRTLLYGSLATLDEPDIAANLPQWTQVVLESNRMKAAAEKVTFAGGAQGRIKHVIYIIKENRTYDQIFGDLSTRWKARWATATRA